MKPLEFYRLATGMVPDANSEFAQRTVVGRLYYGLHTLDSLPTLAPKIDDSSPFRSVRSQC